MHDRTGEGIRAGERGHAPATVLYHGIKRGRFRSESPVAGPCVAEVFGGGGSEDHEGRFAFDPVKYACGNIYIINGAAYTTLTNFLRYTPSVSRR